MNSKKCTTTLATTSCYGKAGILINNEAAERFSSFLERRGIEIESHQHLPHSQFIMDYQDNGILPVECFNTPESTRDHFFAINDQHAQIYSAIHDFMGIEIDRFS